MAEHSELGDIPAEEERRRPVHDDAQLPGQQWQLVQVVRPRHEPAREAAEPHAEYVCDALGGSNSPGVASFGTRAPSPSAQT